MGTLRPRELLPNTSSSLPGSRPNMGSGNQNNTGIVSLPSRGITVGSAPVPTGTTATNTSATSPRRSIPGFVSKLFRMVSEGGPGALIRWTEEGNSFVVTRPEEFSRTILPRYFKHNNFSSFVRQLNMYGFHKVPQVAPNDLVPSSVNGSINTAAGGPTATILDSMWEFTNPNFIRGRPDLLLKVRRKTGGKDDEFPPQGTAGATVASHGGSVLGFTNSTGAGSTEAFHGGMQVMAQELAALRVQQTALRSDLASLQRDSQLLWGETLAARERHQQQQAIIDKILRFLASVFSSTTEAKNLTGQAGPAALNVNITPRKRPLMIEEIPSTPASAEVDELFAPIMKSTPPQNNNNPSLTASSKGTANTIPSHSGAIQRENSKAPGHQNRLFEALRTADAIQGDLDFLVDNLDPSLLQTEEQHVLGDSGENLPLDLDWDTYTNLYPPSQPDDPLLPLGSDSTGLRNHNNNNVRTQNGRHK